MSDPEQLEANKALVRAYYDALINRCDLGALDRFVAEDYFDHPTGKRAGVEGVKVQARALHAAFGDFRVTIDDMVAEGDRVAMRGTWAGVHTGPFRGIAPTGRPFTVTGMVFFRIADGRIAERWAQVDLKTAIMDGR
ncbi:MAG: ester cyclase [Pseudomonadota bacterium]|nr:ester cyclase [Pseudomonadota bacterium]